LTTTQVESVLSPQQRDVTFDEFAGNYDAALEMGLKATGEHKEYFVRRRMAWLRRHLAVRSFTPHKVLDYGCGCGDSCPMFFDELSVESYVGVDVSTESIRRAQERHGTPRREFHNLSALEQLNGFDLAYCNGVFHHIDPAHRLNALQDIFACLRPGGVFAFWENNPWNPGTRWVMSRIPFDRDAIVLTSAHARKLLKSVGFEVLSTNYLFVFPHALRWLRSLELPLAGMPIGGQYQVMAKKPD
jgi:SAM-dependent methyltransferase